jgi:hypothetical protein
VTEIHDAPGVAVHGQPAGAVTWLVSSPVVMHGANSIGATVYWHAPTSPTWTTEKGWPAALMVPVLPAGWSLRATAKVMVPLPVPEAPPVTVTHGESLAAVHEHAGPAAIENDPVPPSFDIEAFCGLIANVQATATPSCSTGTS